MPERDIYILKNRMGVVSGAFTKFRLAYIHARLGRYDMPTNGCANDMSLAEQYLEMKGQVYITERGSLPELDSIEKHEKIFKIFKIPLIDGE